MKEIFELPEIDNNLIIEAIAFGNILREIIINLNKKILKIEILIIFEKYKNLKTILNKIYLLFKNILSFNNKLYNILKKYNIINIKRSISIGLFNCKKNKLLK